MRQTICFRKKFFERTQINRCQLSVDGTHVPRPEKAGNAGNRCQQSVDGTHVPRPEKAGKAGKKEHTCSH